MAKINKSSEESVQKTKSPKKKSKLQTEDISKSNKKSTSSDPEKHPPKKQITKKPKIKSNGMKKAVSLLAVPTKHKKEKQVNVETTKNEDDDDDEEIREPTAEELAESEKPENIKSVLTVRQKKKLKHQKRLEEQKSKCPIKEVARNQEYLLKWKNDFANWKFEKLRQIGVQTTVFDDTKISAEIWPVALEYLSLSKGAAKEKITKAAEAVIDELDKEAENAGDGGDAITSSEKYRRARELLQSFD